MVRVQPTRGGKGGKTVTLIRGLELDGAGFKALLKKLKTRIGSGGTGGGDDGGECRPSGISQGGGGGGAASRA